jgi:hypothetical protein
MAEKISTTHKKVVHAENKTIHTKKYEKPFKPDRSSKSKESPFKTASQKNTPSKALASKTSSAPLTLNASELKC